MPIYGGRDGLPGTHSHHCPIMHNLDVGPLRKRRLCRGRRVACGTERRFQIMSKLLTDKPAGWLLTGSLFDRLPTCLPSHLTTCRRGSGTVSRMGANSWRLIAANLLTDLHASTEQRRRCQLGQIP